MQNDKASPPVGIALRALSLLLVVGVQTFAGSCATHSDGNVGSCVWAARAVLGIGIVLVALSVVRIFERDEGERRGLCVGIASLGVLTALMPGVFIDLCADETMRCVAVFRPFCICVGAVIALVAGIDLVVRLGRIASEGELSKGV